MKHAWILIFLFTVSAAQAKDPVGAAVEDYFSGLFSKLAVVADKKPTAETFRNAMKPAAETVDGFFGGSLISTNFVIEQSYYKFHALANGYDLKKVRQLDYFRERMRTAPAPQLSEPGHGSILQPRLIALRYPFFDNGKPAGIVSMMIRTENFLKASGLDQCHAYRIICRDIPAEEKGILTTGFHEVRLNLPSTEWVIQYNP